MKYNYLVSSYNSILSKYNKYFSRLQRDINNGSFSKLNAARKNFLVRKVEALRTKLASMQPKLAGFAAAAGLVLSLTAFDAQAQFISNRSGNPLDRVFPVQNSTDWSMTALGDLDNDGDQDLMITDSGNLYYYKNKGSRTVARFELQTGTNSPLDGLNASESYSSPVFKDLDGDGDLDIVIGGAYNGTGQQFDYFKNTGTKSNPVFTPQTGTNNPIPKVNGYLYYGSPTIVDIDGDGDLDIFAMDGYYGNVFFLKNTGTKTAPAFSETTVGNPFPSGDVTENGGANSYLYSSFVDFDGDADQDVVLFNRDATATYYKNTGTKTNPVLTLTTGSNNPFAEFSDRWVAPSFADLNGDGKIDMVLGMQDETVVYLNAGTKTALRFERADAVKRSTPAFIDLDKDGDKDLVTGSSSFSGLAYYKNTGSAAKPVYTKDWSSSNPLNSTISLGGWLNPAFFDIDADGDDDLLVGRLNGTLEYYQRTGTNSAPIFTRQTGTNNPWDGLNAGYESAPCFVDLDNDGDKDVVVGHRYGIAYAKNTGTTTAPVFTLNTSTANNPAGAAVSSYGRYKPAFIDSDADGDLDMVVGTDFSVMPFYQNTGTATAAVYTQVTGTSSPFNNTTSFIGDIDNIAPAIVDLDNDGDLDIVVGNFYGTFDFLENRKGQVTGILAPIAASFNEAIVAYPNPVKDQLSFSLNDAIGSALNVSILDVTGTELLNKTYTNDGASMNLNVANLNPGVYVLKLSAEAKSSVVRFVKQ